MIGPIEFAPGLFCGSRPETAADMVKMDGFIMVDLEMSPYHRCHLWFPLGSILPPSKWEVAQVINALSTPSDWPRFLHCRTCRDRTPYILAKYSMVRMGRSRREVFQFIEQFKPHWWLAWWRLFI